MSEKEIWASNIKGNIFLKTFDNAGKLTDTVIRSGKKIALSTEERKINQEMAASKDLDLFMNGMLTPVVILESAEDYAEIASNPNLISEGEMQDLLKVKGRAFTSRIKEITNLSTLQRLAELAELDGTITVTQLRSINDRIADLSPDTQIVDREVLVPEGLNAKPVNAS